VASRASKHLIFAPCVDSKRNRLRKVFDPSHDAVIRVYDDAGNVIETHEHVGDFKEP